MNDASGALPADFLPSAQVTKAAEIAIPRDPFIADFGHKFVNFGSCFAQNVKRIFDGFGFDSFFVSEICAHYNTESLANTLEIAASGRPPSNDDLAFIDGKYYGYRNHLKYAFTGHDAAKTAIDRIAGLYETLRGAVAESDTIVITLGTSRVARLKSNGQPIIVAAGLSKDHWDFDMLDSHQNVANLRRVISSLKTLRGGKPANIVFTVSPQRYLFGHMLVEGQARHEGMALVDNFYSKCNLRVAVEELVQNPPEDFTVRYFPALEVVYEELRQFETLAHYDYCHISEQNTADLVVKKFLTAYATEAVLEQLSAGSRISRLFGEIHKFRQGGAVPGDPATTAIIDKIEAELTRFGRGISAPLLAHRFTLAAQFGRPLTELFTNFPYHRGDNAIADARILMQLRKPEGARAIIRRVIDRYGPRRTLDPEAGLVIEHHIFNEACAVWNALPKPDERVS